MPARIALAEPPYAADIQQDFDAIMPPGVPPLAIFRAAARNPRILHKLRAGNLLDRGSIEKRTRELVILRACARAGAEYEWGVHVGFFAERVGLTAELVAATVRAAWNEAPWTGPGREADRALIRLVDELHDTARLSDEAWAELRRHCSDEQAIELIMLAGQYRMIGGLVNALQVPLEPWAPRFPAHA